MLHIERYVCTWCLHIDGINQNKQLFTHNEEEVGKDGPQQGGLHDADWFHLWVSGVDGCLVSQFSRRRCFMDARGKNTPDQCKSINHPPTYQSHETSCLSSPTLVVHQRLHADHHLHGVPERRVEEAAHLVVFLKEHTRRQGREGEMHIEIDGRIHPSAETITDPHKTNNQSMLASPSSAY